jgi:hypothetical protein
VPGTVNLTVVVAPTAGVLVAVETEVVVDVEWVDEPVVGGAFETWCRAVEQLVAAIAAATRATPVIALRVAFELLGRLRCPGTGGRRHR